MIVNVVVTRQAKGNDAAALFNAALGNSIGVFVSPGVLYFTYPGENVFSDVPIGSTLLNLVETVN
jgi:solute carrier family 10 (sodium/bile acid cotransporter), member 7